ncbi:MAG: P1 family peptidase [Actinomycetota bacterium]|nr:P1 family peptidase [Actinomycetota bacterium]
MTEGLGHGWKIGHWTDPDARTGCTVVLPPRGNVCSCDIRGSSPSSRELTLLDSDRRLTEVHAVLLTGGSAFGLAAADGVVSWLAEHGIGYETRVTPVPIVPAAVVFDLGAGRHDVRPGPEQGRLACEAAVEGAPATGPVGAGAGTTVGKWAGLEHAVPAGFGFGVASEDGARAAAAAVVNAVGDVLGPDGSVLAGSTAPPGTRRFMPRPATPLPVNTVLAVVAVEGTFDKREVRWLASRGSDGITVSVRPAHTRYDGDVVFALAAPAPADAPPAELDLLGALATDAVAAAVRAAVTPADDQAATRVR